MNDESLRFALIGGLLFVIAGTEFILALWNFSQRKKMKALSWHVMSALVFTGLYSFMTGLTYLRAGAGLDFDLYYKLSWVGFLSLPAVTDIALDLRNSADKWRRYKIRALYAFWTGVLYFCFTTNLLENVPSSLIPYVGTTGQYEWFVRLCAVLQIAYVVFAAIRASKRARGLNRSRLGYLAIGMCVYGAIAVFTIQPLYTLPFDPILTSLFSIFFAIPVAYSTGKYRLFDLRILFSKLAVAVTATVVVLGIYLGISTTLSSAPVHWLASITAAMVVGILVFMTPLFRSLRKMITYIICRQRIPDREILGALSGALMNSANLDDALRKTGQNLQRGLGLVTFGVILRDKKSLKARILDSNAPDAKLDVQNLKLSKFSEQQLVRLSRQNQDIFIREEAFVEGADGLEITPEASVFTTFEQFGRFEVIVPLVSKGEFLGLMGLGPRVDTLAYSNEDINLVVTIASQLALYIENARLFNEAIEDGLTGLFNQKYFKARLANEVAKLRRHPRSVALLLMDIDHFKQINDTHGHLMGDFVLASIGPMLKSFFRAEDIVARYGGEEFAIILIEPDPAMILAIAERMRTKIESHNFSDKFKVTVSIGIYATPPTKIMQTLTAADFIERADLALYEAKRGGRNRTVTFSPEEIPTPD